MKLLVQVSAIESDLETKIGYAIIEVNDAMRQHLAKRLELFSIVKQSADDLADMRFHGCDFVTFHNYVDLDSCGMDEDEEHVFNEQGYWKVPDDFANDEDAADWELEKLIIDGDSFSISAGESYGAEIITRAIPFALLELG